LIAPTRHDPNVARAKARFSIARDGEQMEPDKQLLEAWENGVQLGHAWWAFADVDTVIRHRLTSPLSRRSRNGMRTLKRCWRH
jgi:hypothetical protein